MADTCLKFTPAFGANRHRENNAQYYQRNTAGKVAAKLLRVLGQGTAVHTVSWGIKNEYYSCNNG